MPTNPSTKKLVVIGAGGFGREVLELIEDVNQQEYRYDVVGVLDDGSPDHALLDQLGVAHLGGTDVLKNFDPDVGYVIGIGGCAARRAIDQQCQEWGREAVTLVHPTAVIGRRSVELGAGTVVCANSTITTNVRLGRHVHVNPNVSIGHDSTVGDYTTLTPQVAVAGNVTIGAEVFAGTGARFRPSVRIADGVLVGAGAVVINDVTTGTVAGVPARQLSR